jgi:vesicle-associated membrane protein 7
MSDEATKRRVTFSFLEDIKKIWRDNYASVERTALAFSMNESFSPVLRQRIVSDIQNRTSARWVKPAFNHFLVLCLCSWQEYFNTNPSSDNISKVQAQIDTVKDVMIENIDRVLERGERIELLVDKTDRLNQQAFKFEKTVGFLQTRFLEFIRAEMFWNLFAAHLHSSPLLQSRSLKNTMYYRKIRNIVMVVVVVGILIFFVVAMICNFDFQNCRS